MEERSLCVARGGLQAGRRLPPLECFGGYMPLRWLFLHGRRPGTPLLVVPGDGVQLAIEASFSLWKRGYSDFMVRGLGFLILDS